ncbi:MAG: hypothetical protein NTW21_16460 [Verrucomicrobia bacterium]|nr:hypothetical protein [Verrucomicrobiota bacterium]
MKPNHQDYRRFHLAAWVTAVALVTAHDAMGTPIVGDTITGNLTVTGWGKFANGVDLGQNGEVLFNWLPADLSNPVGTATFDMVQAQGAFLWRDTITAAPTPSAKNKMKLDRSNALTLYKSDGTVGQLFDPENGKITLATTGINSGIFFGNSTLPTLKAAASGAAIFPAQVTLQNGLQLTGTGGLLQVGGTTPATSSSTGALTVTGGIGVGMDSYFNGVRVGKGAGNLTTNTVIGTGALNSNTAGYYNTASGMYALYANTRGGYNTAAGVYALFANTTGGNNTAVGMQSMQSNTTGTGNTSLGYQAACTNTFGSNNVALGRSAASYQANGTTPLTDPENSIYVGANVKGKDNNDSNSIVIGSSAIGEGANTTVIGNASTTKTHLYGELVASNATLGGYPVLTTRSGTNATLTNGATLALGYNAAATQQGTIAIGQNAQATINSALALGDYAYAVGCYATAIQQGYASGAYSFAASWGLAEGDYSLGMATGQAFSESSIAVGGFDETESSGNCAMGIGSVALGGRLNVASGEYSYAMGSGVISSSAYNFAIGSQNLSCSNSITPIGDTGWIEESALLEVGNGNPDATTFETSNAITTLKNGQTTLTNKAWKARPVTTSPLADPSAATTDSDGNALVIEGHTVLKGKVVIEQAQGDISMGIYE